MSSTLITVENLSKRYLIGHESVKREHHRVLRDIIAREARSFARKAADMLHGRQIIQGDEVEELWALRNVNFEVKQGEVLGIIGRNGAGKSTLLKILSRITEPTEGRVRLRGRVGSLLEVGTGFHPELTGRENIFLNGAILGMARNEIDRKFDEIVAFAEIDKFVDTPVKRYSTGMYVRLAFAVAAHLEPEILVVDEVLAVGDSEFQRKCLGKMGDASRREGKTVLFVSHNMGAMVSLCPSAICLDNGNIVRRGNAREVIRDYLALHTPNRERLLNLEDCPRSGGDGRLRLISLEWLCDLPLQHGQAVRGRIQFRTQGPLQDVTVGIGFSNFEGCRLLTYETDFPEGHRRGLMKPGNYTVEVEVDSLPLAPDNYYLDVGCRSGDYYALDYIMAAAELEVVPGPTTPAHIARKNAAVRLPSKWVWTERIAQNV
jgi:lipopolysaccharide transport system ATP-binding protein